MTIEYINWDDLVTEEIIISEDGYVIIEWL